MPLLPPPSVTSATGAGTSSMKKELEETKKRGASKTVYFESRKKQTADAYVSEILGVLHHAISNW
jgi:hypothetical protein